MKRQPVIEFVTGFDGALAVALVSAVAGIAAAHASFWPIPLPIQRDARGARSPRRVSADGRPTPRNEPGSGDRESPLGRSQARISTGTSPR